MIGSYNISMDHDMANQRWGPDEMSMFNQQGLNGSMSHINDESTSFGNDNNNVSVNFNNHEMVTNVGVDTKMNSINAGVEYLQSDRPYVDNASGDNYSSQIQAYDPTNAQADEQDSENQDGEDDDGCDEGGSEDADDMGAAMANGNHQDAHSFEGKQSQFVVNFFLTN
jgi:hypothetical protein